MRSVAQRLPGVADHVERVQNSSVNTVVLRAAALLVCRKAFDAVYGFDQRSFLHGENMDLSKCGAEAGWRVVVTPGGPSVALASREGRRGIRKSSSGAAIDVRCAVVPEQASVIAVSVAVVRAARRVRVSCHAWGRRGW